VLLYTTLLERTTSPEPLSIPFTNSDSRMESREY
jgi:hypothetical protein